MASLFSIPVDELAPKSGDRRVDRGVCPLAPGHRAARAWREGLDMTQMSWEDAAAGSSAEVGASGQRGTLAPPTALPDPSSQLWGGLGGVGHPADAVEGEAEPGSRQQQSQGGQQPPPRLGPPPCCQLHLEQAEVPWS